MRLELSHATGFRPDEVCTAADGRGNLWCLHPRSVDADATSQKTGFAERTQWPHAWLKDYQGYLQTDPSTRLGAGAFAGYGALHATGRVVEVGCWAHARRGFFDARELAKTFALRVLEEIGRL